MSVRNHRSLFVVWFNWYIYINDILDALITKNINIQVMLYHLNDVRFNRFESQFVGKDRTTGTRETQFVNKSVCVCISEISLCSNTTWLYIFLVWPVVVAAVFPKFIYRFEYFVVCRLLFRKAKVLVSVRPQPACTCACGSVSDSAHTDEVRQISRCD